MVEWVLKSVSYLSTRFSLVPKIGKRLYKQRKWVKNACFISHFCTSIPLDPSTVDEDMQMIPAEMSSECVTQAWFRFLHIMQNPVDLSRPAVVSNTPRFLQHALTNEAVLDPSQHECLLKLPTIFFKAMRGLSVMVNAFLGQFGDRHVGM